LISVANAQHHIRRGTSYIENDINVIRERTRVLKGQSTHRNLVTTARAKKKKKKQKKKKLSLNNESIYNTNNSGGRTKQKMKGKKKKGLNNIFNNNANDGRFNNMKKKTNGRYMNKKKGMKKKKQQQLLLQTNNNNNQVVETRDQFLTMKNTGIGCLQQTNPYRTCIDRQSNRESIIHTYLPPHTTPKEQLINGQVYLSLLQDSTPVNCTTIEQFEEYTLSYLLDNIGSNRKFDVACVQVDERGFDRSGIQLVDNDNNSRRKNVFNRQLQREVIKSNTLRLHVTYVEKNIDDTSTQQQDIEDTGEEEEVLFNVDSTIEKIYQDDEELQQLHTQGRSLQTNTGADECTPIQRALCCTQHSINNERGQWCSKLGCNVQHCGTGRRRPENNFFNRRDLVEEKEEDEGLLEEHRVEDGDEQISFPVTNSNNKANNRRLAYPLRPYILKDKDYTEGLNKYTDFEADESWSQLDMENVDNVAVCSANRYGVIEVSQWYLSLLACYCTVSLIYISHSPVISLVWNTNINM